MISKDFTFKTWQEIEPFYLQLQEKNINSVDELYAWFVDRSVLESFLSENLAWRYIRQTCNTADEDLQKELDFFIEEIQPQIASFTNKLNQKALNSPFLDALLQTHTHKQALGVMVRTLRKQAAIFREENIPLLAQIQSKERIYGSITGKMSVNLDIEGVTEGVTQGVVQEFTLQQAANFLENNDRNIRKNVYKTIQNRRLEDKNALDELLSELIQLRHKVARNAGFANFRDYMFAYLGRFDYTPKDCFDFHKAVSTQVMPIVNDFAKERKSALNLSELRIWDEKVDISGLPALKPFTSGEDLTEKTINIFQKMHPEMGECLQIMQKSNLLDLASRKNKAPGGYNYPLESCGLSFIFMNATSNLRDMSTLLHEGGHALHFYLIRNLDILAFRNPPAEVAELASMAMELITMDFWDEFFPEKQQANDLKRAKIEHLQETLATLPWVACVDKFQHWLYENPTHALKDRTDAWDKIYKEFSDKITDWSGCEQFFKNHWQKQLHIYEVPFYYIEYGFAQLGAIAVWKNYKENPQKGLNDYLNALKLGYTKTIPEIYETAGIKFDFSEEYIKSLMDFVAKELSLIN